MEFNGILIRFQLILTGLIRFQLILTGFNSISIDFERSSNWISIDSTGILVVILIRFQLISKGILIKFQLIQLIRFQFILKRILIKFRFLKGI